MNLLSISDNVYVNVVQNPYLIRRYWRHTSKILLRCLREGEGKNENKIQKN